MHDYTSAYRARCISHDFRVSMNQVVRVATQSLPEESIPNSSLQLLFIDTTTSQRSSRTEGHPQAYMISGTGVARLLLIYAVSGMSTIRIYFKPTAFIHVQRISQLYMSS